MIKNTISEMCIIRLDSLHFSIIWYRQYPWYGLLLHTVTFSNKSPFSKLNDFSFCKEMQQINFLLLISQSNFVSFLKWTNYFCYLSRTWYNKFMKKKLKCSIILWNLVLLSTSPSISC